MNSPSSNNFPVRINIPKLFYSDATGSPFETCIQCHRSLNHTATHYLIEKAVKAYPQYKTTDTVFEYAICIACYMEMRKSLSQESTHNLEMYFQNNINLLKRRDILLQNNSPNIDEWISECIVKQTPIHNCTEYQLVCECQGDQMLLNFMPYLVSGEAMDEMMDLLSNQTLDFLNGFRDRFLGPPPDVREILKPSRMIML